MSKELEKVARRYLSAIYAEGKSVKSRRAIELESKGAEVWLRTLGSRTFTGSFSSFHKRMWSWYWAITLKRLRNEPLTEDELAFLAIWFRGGGKSANVEWACIAEGAVLGEGYVMYVSDTESQAKGHVAAIRDRLESSEIAEYYPGLAAPEVGKHGAQVGWRQDYLATASGWGIIPVGLDQGIRGGRKNDLRFTMIVLDDVDDHNDSPAAVQKKLDTIARSILPAGQRDTIVLFAQNLIHEDSVLNQIVTRRSDILAERIVSGPIKAFEDLELDLSEEGSRVWKIKHAIPTWPDIDMGAARRFLARSGRASFMAEYQHDFTDDKLERVLKNWNDGLQVIRRSDFARIFGTRHVPDEWYKYAFHDWSRTKSQWHANVCGKVAVSSQNSALPGRIFLFDLMSFPAATEPDDVAVRFLKSLTPDNPDQWDEIIRASLTRTNLEQYIHNTTQLIEARRNILADIIPNIVRPLLEEQNFLEFRMSHEAKTQREIYDTVFGLPFSPADPGEDGGIDWLNHYMKAIETNRNPFFPEKMGEPWLYMVVEDDKYSYPSDALPDNLHDSDLARYQFRHWKNRPLKLNEAGIVEHGPMKMNDDFGNGLMMLFVDNIVQAAPMTKEERLDARLPEHLKPAAVRAKLGTPEFVDAYWEREAQLKLAREAEENEIAVDTRALARFFPRPVRHRRYRRRSG